MPPIPSLATSSGRNFTQYIEGTIPEGETAKTDSYSLKSATMGFGLLVVQDTLAGDCKVMAADADQQLGISLATKTNPASTDGNNTVQYVQNDKVAVVRDGVIAVTAFEQVRRNDAVLAITAQGGKLASPMGGVAGAGRVLVVGAKWMDDVAAGAVGRVMVQMIGTTRLTA